MPFWDTDSFKIPSKIKFYLRISSYTPLHDDDGNLIDDGKQLYTYNGENRLIEVRRKLDNALLSTYHYDEQGRRIRKTTTAEAPQGATDILYLWDNWLNIAELDYTPLTDTITPRNYYIWGNDLSSSEQGAGGVGGLLFIRQAPTNDTHAYTYDGNGNVTGLYDMNNAGVETAKYEYGPFGESLHATGGMADENPYRFSTKYQDEETDFLYYGYRYYNAHTGRWINRDPIEESGGVHLYGFLGNNSVNMVDFLGQDPADFKSPIWHHRIPQKLQQFVGSVVDVHAASYGWILEEADHRKLNNIYDQAWDAFVERNQGIEITKQMIEAELNVIEARFKKQLSRGEPAVISYSKWKRLRPQIMKAKKTITSSASMRSAGRTAGRIARVLVVYTVVEAYHTARANGYSTHESLNQAAGEVINVTPWSVAEMVEAYKNNSNWDYVLSQSMEAHTRGNNLFDGFSDPKSTSSRAYYMRKFLTECYD